MRLTKRRETDDSTTPQNLKKIIRGIGIKVTDQRILILEEILNGETHVTAQEVYESVKQKNSAVGFATVYRFLRTLSDHKILSEVRVQGLPARYEWANKFHHDHITCTSCGTISEFENNKIEEMQRRIAESLGFQMTHHILELYGICGECHKKNQKNLATLPAFNFTNPQIPPAIEI